MQGLSFNPGLSNLVADIYASLSSINVLPPNSLACTSVCACFLCHSAAAGVCVSLAVCACWHWLRACCWQLSVQA